MTRTDSSGGLLHIAQLHNEGVQLGLWSLRESESDFKKNHYKNN